MKDKLKTIIGSLNETFTERESEISGLLLSVISGENIIFIGSEGADDHSLTEKVGECVDGSVSKLMVSSSTVGSEISDTNGILILDDVLNANSTAMNTIIGLMDSDRTMVCGTSRKVPNEDDDAFSLYNAFLLRCDVTSAESDEVFLNRMTSSDAVKNVVKLSADDISKIAKAAEGIEIDQTVLSAMLSLRDALAKNGKTVTDARWKNSLRLMRFAAAGIGCDKVGIEFMPLLQHILWDRPEERKEIRRLVFSTCTPKSVDVSDLMSESEEILKRVVESKGALDENAGFPRIVYCYDCDESFANLKRLRQHHVNNPRHTFADPNETENKVQRYKRYAFEELMTLLTSKYRWEIFKSSDAETKEQFMKETSEMKKRTDAIANGFENDRKELLKAMENNIWLSVSDRHDLMTAFDRRQEMLNTVGELISDAEMLLQ